MLKARIPKDRVADVYRNIAPVYDVWAWLTETRARALGLELAAIADGESVLEVAVGTGLAFEQIAAANPSGRNEGVELSEAMLKRARRRLARSGAGRYRLTVGDAYDLDFDDDEFDVLINNYMFDLLPQQDFADVLAEFRRVLRPGGRIVVVSMTDGQRWYNRFWEWIYRAAPALIGGCRGVRLSPYLEQGGFVDVRRVYLSQATFPSEVVAARCAEPGA